MGSWFHVQPCFFWTCGEAACYGGNSGQGTLFISWPEVREGQRERELESWGREKEREERRENVHTGNQAFNTWAFGEHLRFEL